MTEMPELQAQPEQEEEELLPFFPHYLLDEIIAWYVMLGVLVVLASLFPVGLEEQADPLRTPPHIKPEWYFLFLYQALKLVPRTVGILLPMVGVAILFFLPFIDRNPEVAPRKRVVAISLALIVLAAIIGLTVWGAVS